MASLKIIFMGTPDFALPSLRALCAARHAVIAVYTQKPRKAGRGQAVRKSPVHLFAEHNNLPVFTPDSLKPDDVQKAFMAHDADAAIVAAYGLILPKAVLQAPRYGCINVHASLLPRWRGAAPIQRAIMAGDMETGITIMQMDEGLDTGPMLSTRAMPLSPDITAGELHDRLAELGASEIIDVLQQLTENGVTRVPQPDVGVTYAAKIDKAETRIDWSRAAGDIHNMVRALSPAPGAWFSVRRESREERIKVLSADIVEAHGAPGEILNDRLDVACGGGAVRLVKIQRAGKAATSARDFLRGFDLPPGMKLQ